MKDFAPLQALSFAACLLHRLLNPRTGCACTGPLSTIQSLDANFRRLQHRLEKFDDGATTWSFIMIRAAEQRTEALVDGVKQYLWQGDQRTRSRRLRYIPSPLWRRGDRRSPFPPSRTRDCRVCRRGEFITLANKDGLWKITRVISFGPQSLAK